jgi:Tn3 transposase DDE domain
MRADGLNLGLTRMADARPGISVSRLNCMAHRQICEQTYMLAVTVR